MSSVIDNPELARRGFQEIKWFYEKMPVLREIKRKFKSTKPFKSVSIAICMHVEPKTAVWLDTLLEGGAESIDLVGCVGSTRASTAAYLASKKGVTVLARERDTVKDHKKFIHLALKEKKCIFLDNGGSLIRAWHELGPSWEPLGSTEETISGKLRICAEVKKQSFPIIVIDDSPLKQTLENTLGVGQSVVDGLMRATSLILGGKRVAIIGYGWCGRGVSMRLKGMGAIPMVYDNDPLRLLQAKLEGNIVGSLSYLLSSADVVITVTGVKDILTQKNFYKLKDGVILANAGHFSDEIDVETLFKNAKSREQLNKNVTKVTVSDKVIFLLNNANLLNLAAADGNPIEIMDMGLGLQSLCAETLVKKHYLLKKGVQPIPDSINNRMAKICLNLWH